MIPQPLAILIFRLILASILLLIQWFFYRRISNYVAERWKSEPRKYLVAGLFMLFNAPLIILIFVRPRFVDIPDWFLYLGLYPFYIWHGSFFFLFLIVAFGYVMKWLLRAIVWIVRKARELGGTPARAPSQRTAQWHQSRRLFLRRGVTVLGGVVFAGTAYGAVARNEYEITNTTIPIRRLPAAFEGFTITLVADVHSGLFMSKDEMDRYVAEMNALNSDMIVLPGDLVNSQIAEVYPFAEAFSHLRAPMGVYATLGNHDFFTNPDAVTREVEECGIRVLRNERVELIKNGEKLCVLGVDDTARRERARTMFDKVLEGSDEAIPKILLFHRPYFFDDSVARGIDLTLSGHTHGGQIVLMRIGGTTLAPASLASPYVAGLYRKRGMSMYVTRGIGVVGLPIRINCAPEIAKIRLVRA